MLVLIEMVSDERSHPDQNQEPPMGLWCKQNRYRVGSEVSEGSSARRSKAVLPLPCLLLDEGLSESFLFIEGPFGSGSV